MGTAVTGGADEQHAGSEKNAQRRKTEVAEDR